MIRQENEEAEGKKRRSGDEGGKSEEGARSDGPKDRRQDRNGLPTSLPRQQHNNVHDDTKGGRSARQRQRIVQRLSCL